MTIDFTPEGAPLCCGFVLRPDGGCSKCGDRYDLVNLHQYWRLMRDRDEEIAAIWKTGNKKAA